VIIFSRRSPEVAAAALKAWLEGYPKDGRTWARPCPLCGALVTEGHAAEHLKQHEEEA
jgi:hypothetical protein